MEIVGKYGQVAAHWAPHMAAALSHRNISVTSSDGEVASEFMKSIWSQPKTKIYAKVYC
jgi:hypothetical protein